MSSEAASSKLLHQLLGPENVQRWCLGCPLLLHQRFHYSTRLIESLINRVDLSESEAEASLDFLLHEANEALISAFLVLLRAKGELMKNQLERGDRIELLVDKTATMQDSAFHFKKQSRRLSRALWMKNAKLLCLELYSLSKVPQIRPSEEETVQLQCPVPEPQSPTSSKEADHPTWVLGLEAPFVEDINLISPGLECFERVNADLHGLPSMQLQLLKMESGANADGLMLTPSDNDVGQGFVSVSEDNEVFNDEKEVFQ
ncbi:unnamed protein product [Camellia sinensis]